jgi:hypothetical protein
MITDQEQANRARAWLQVFDHRARSGGPAPLWLDAVDAASLADLMQYVIDTVTDRQKERDDV